MHCKCCGFLIDDESRFCKCCGMPAIENAKAYTYEPSRRIPIVGILGLTFITIALMINLYSYQIVSELKANLQTYYQQLNDPSIVGQLGGKVIDFFTGGAQTQKKKDIEQMEKDLENGLRVMELGLVFAGLASIIGFFAVIRNVKRPFAGRKLFVTSYIFAFLAPVIIIWASVMLLMFTGILLLGVTASLLGIMFLIIEAEMLKIHKKPAKIRHKAT